MGRPAPDGLPTFGDASHRVHRALAVLVTLLAGLATAAPAEAGSGASSVPYTLVIGDSLTFNAKDKLAAMHPDWVIDGVGGRGVNALGPVLQRHLTAEGVPSTVVMALGTNSGDGSWTKADYVAATKMVPASTSIVLVTLWRDPVIYGQVIADRLGKWSQWMTQIARDRPNTETAWWRAVASNHPELLADGVHATDPDGEAAWAAQVDAAVAR